MPESESEMPYSIEYSHISYIGVPKMKNANFEIFDFFLHGHIFQFVHNPWFAITAITASP